MIKELEIFGITFRLKVAKEKIDDDEFSRESSLKARVLNLILILFFIIISKNMYIGNNSEYKVGDVVSKNIYAPKTVLYNDKNKRKELLYSLIETSKQSYRYIPEVREKSIKDIDSFFDEILNEKNKKTFDLKEIEKKFGNKISKRDIRYIFFRNTGEIQRIRQRILKAVDEAYKCGVIKEGKETVIYSPEEDIFSSLTDRERGLAESFIKPNYIYDSESDGETISEKVKKIQEQIVEVNAGSLLIKKGERVDEIKQTLIELTGASSAKQRTIFFGINFLYIIICTSIFYPILVNGFKEEILKKNIYKSLTFVFILSFLIYRFLNIKYIYFVPFETIIFLMYILYKKRFAFFASLMLLFYLFPLVEYNSIFLIIAFFTILLSNYLANKVSTRQELIIMGMKIAIVKFLLYLIFSYLKWNGQELLIFQGSQILISGFISGMLTIAVLPYFERTFNILTIFRLAELGDMSHPLLKLLSTQAPGTFYHSLMVSTLSEAAAEAIGANAIFARVASYYHDIGKIKRAKFYVENQEDADKEHAKITPSLSAMIITAHTKDGNELGRKYQIPKEIRDIMFEHQGTTLLAYFYNKAKQSNPNVLEDDFRYSGPIPKTKESAIIMLADSVEAAVRSLDEKTQLKIEAMVRKIVNAKIEENQLLDSDITFKELEIIIKTFTRVLMSIHHARIKYPGQK